MTEIIPSINVLTFEEVKKRIKQVEPYVSWCHLDVTDGVFSTHPTWRDPADLALLDTALRVEVHLMVENPEAILDKWLVYPVKRIIVHAEASRDVDGIINACKKAGIECGVAVNRETPVNALLPWAEKADVLQILAVRPGPSGQGMGGEIIEKIAHLRALCPGCMLEVDGGINRETAEKVIIAGADIIVAGSVIFNSTDIGGTIAALHSLAVSP